jgi:Replication initiator protein A (RepA) N-terminus.
LSERIVFDYFTGQESEMLAFYRIPKLLFTNAYFKGLDALAKTLYGLMLDRMSLSLKNKWFDELQRAFYILCSAGSGRNVGMW